MRSLKSVYDASSSARAAIIQRVFTESLNAVWRSVFTRSHHESRSCRCSAIQR